MKKLIICEKPSLSKNVSQAIQKTGESITLKNKKYAESNNYIVVPAFGHLYELFNISDYSGQEKQKWSMAIIPFIPEKFIYKVKNDKGIKEQVKLINELIRRDDVDGIINCGDSDREGEIIIRNIISMTGTKKQVYRLWLPDQVESSIINGLKTMKESSAYDNLANEGYARIYIDWLYGINLTVYASVKYKGLVRVGRVISAIVRLIYDRQKEIENFKPETYYQTVSKELTNDVIVELVNEKYENISDAEIESNKLNVLDAKVIDVSSKEKNISSPKLFSLSKLQNVLSKRYAFKPSKTLELVQSLYERGYVSYPRTPTEYLATAEVEKIKSIIEVINSINDELIFKNSKKIFNDEKIESHSAITPTTKIPTEFKNDDEEKCYNAILNRFKAVFLAEEHMVSETILKIQINEDYEYEIKGIATIHEGWTKYEEKTTKDKAVPAVKIGDIINTNFIVEEKQTTPPKKYTVETLNNKLRNPFKREIAASEALELDEGEDDTEDYINLLKGLEIGTEATRSGIIDKAIKSNYINLDKSTYSLADAGEKLIHILDTLEIDMSIDKTAEMGRLIKSVYANKITIDEVIEITSKNIKEIIGKNLDLDIQKEYPDKKTDNIFGVCPRCSGDIIDTPKAYSCKKCSFTLWKNNKFLANAGKKLTPTLAKKLIKNGKASVKGLKSKKGTTYDCIVLLEDTGKYVNLKPFFGGKS